MGRLVGSSAAFSRVRYFWWWVLAAYVIARLVTTTLLIVAAGKQDPRAYFGEPGGYWSFVNQWDGKWYGRAATEGYPAVLPRDEAGVVHQNTWAFSPLYPILIRLTMTLTTLPLRYAAPLVATTVGVLSVVAVALLFRSVVGERAAVAGAVLYSFSPVSASLQISYSESTAVTCLALTLWALHRRQWLAAGALALLTGLARPAGAPLTLVALVAVGAAWWSARRSGTRLMPRTVLRMGAAVAGCAISGWLWAGVAWQVTGEMRAYTETFGAWRGGKVELFTKWWDSARYLMSDTKAMWSLVLLAVFTLAMVLGPWAAGMGLVQRTWALAYPAYLAAVEDPWTSTFRHLILFLPWFVILTGGGWRPRVGEHPRAPRWLLPSVTGALVVLFTVLQTWWIFELVSLDYPSDWPP